jgi:lysophospholipase L1-like esterase
MKKTLKHIFIICLVTLIMLEIGSRLFFPVRLNYNQVLRRLLGSPERIHSANISIPYDIQGLYDGADTIELNVSTNRFIQPEPLPELGDFRVLFLGGSTTESIYVPQDQRWVARINDHPEIAAYNGAQSGANIIDKYHTFDYFTEQGFEFDLVVIMTTVNDYAWMRRLANVGFAFQHETYQAGLEANYRAINPFNPLELSNLYRYMTDLISEKNSPQTIVERMLEQNNIEESIGTLAECDVDELLKTFRTYETDNLQRLYESVTQTGADLLVLSEATSYLASPESYETFLFTGAPCGTDIILDSENSSLLFEQLNQVYLEVGESTGAFIFDLAIEIEKTTDSPEGGQYMYDPVHYTPQGNQLVADTLVPVLVEIFEGK